MQSGSLLPFPGAVKRPSPERRRTAPNPAGGPASLVVLDCLDGKQAA